MNVRVLLTGWLVLILAVSLPIGVAGQPESSPIAGAPGQLVRWEPIPSIGEHPAWRILYMSSSLDGGIVPISGVIAVPDQPAPAAGFPLLVVAHPTAGLARQCAPSLLLQDDNSLMARLYQEILTPYLDAGFAIVMSDYQGLGVAGGPSYLIGAIEGRNVLDSARAVSQFPDVILSGSMQIIGHSQGGHAAAFALQLAPEYAPELAFDSAMLAAPALDPQGIFEDVVDAGAPTENLALVLMVMSSWSAAYPDAVLTDVVTPAGEALIAGAIEQSCVFEAGAAAGDVDPAAIVRPEAATVWSGLAEMNTPQPQSGFPPMLIVHGDDDEVIDPDHSADFADRFCAIGGTVEFVRVAGADHFGVLRAAGPDMVAWLLARVGGDPFDPVAHSRPACGIRHRAGYFAVEPGERPAQGRVLRR